MIRNPKLFRWLKQITRGLIRGLNYLDDILWSIFHPWKMGRHEWNLISAIAASMAANLHHALDSSSVPFALSYIAFRAVLSLNLSISSCRISCSSGETSH